MAITKGQRYEPTRGHDGKGVRELTVLQEEVADTHGRVFVQSVNNTAKSRRSYFMKPKTLLSSAYKLIPLVLIFVMAACAGAPKKNQTAVCNEAPQWTTADANGNPLGIYVCFGTENQLLWSVRALPPAPPTSAQKAAPVRAAVIAGSPPKPADPKDIAVLNAMSDTLRKVEKKAAKQRASERSQQLAAKPNTTLPTLGGTATEPTK